ncbi:unnamed protein product [Pieris macdunnoughi]|uniref:Uncharacterized protein n=1 Tax=Pieris macdunnoughi TaxID=345717 RepID=A0A821SX44_9NEOP|nr:unnamed protein product [Pieris macdunnoughi]
MVYGSSNFPSRVRGKNKCQPFSGRTAKYGKPKCEARDDIGNGGSVALLWKPLSMATGIGRKIQDGGSISIDGESFPTPY